MRKFINIFIFIAEKFIDILIFFAKIIMGVLGIIKAKHLGFLLLISFLGIVGFGAVNVTLRPFSDEITNLDKFIDYYQETDEENGGYSLLSSNYYTASKIYDLENKKILGSIEESGVILKKPERIPYKVVSGDTLSGISSKFNQKIAILKTNNPDLTANIRVGQIIDIASINGIFYKVKNGDTLYKIAYKYKVNVEDIRSYNELESDELSIGQEIFLKDPDIEIVTEMAPLGSGFKMPVTYTGVSSPYGNRFHPVLKRYISHAGVDLRARYIPVYASRGGTVTFAGTQSGYGKIVKISHVNGYETRYAHLNKIYVKKGQKVKQGDNIGQSGMTGRVTGPHLHFEIRRNGKTLNPMKVLDR